MAMAQNTTISLKNPFSKKDFPNVYEGHQYALDVVSKKKLACKYVIGACNRYLNDIAKKEYIFDVERAERYLRLVQNFEHVKGDWKSNKIIYEPWQKFVFMNIEGFVNKKTKI